MFQHTATEDHLSNFLHGRDGNRGGDVGHADLDFVS